MWSSATISDLLFAQGVELHGSSWTARDYQPEVVRGNDLWTHMEQEGSMSEAKARYVFGQLVEAVHYLYGIGISHGDIKKLNVLIDSDLKVCTTQYIDRLYRITDMMISRPR